jgi:hypothetical protein
MATPNLQLVTPTNGSDVGTWDVPVNANSTALDTAFGGLATLNANGLSGVQALTLPQLQCANLVITGTPTGNVTYALPAGGARFFFVDDNTGGAFTVGFSSASGGAVAVIPKGAATAIVIDPTNGARLADSIPAAPAGSNGWVQFNNGGVFAGAPGMIYSAATEALALGGNLSVAGNLSLIGNVVTQLVVQAMAATTPVPVAFSPTAMSMNCNLSNVFTTTFTANVTVAPNIGNPNDGQTINWFITQDASGGRTMTWPASFKWPGGVKGVLSTAAGTRDLLVATYLAAAGAWYASLIKAFS